MLAEQTHAVRITGVDVPKNHLRPFTALISGAETNIPCAALASDGITVGICHDQHVRAAIKLTTKAGKTVALTLSPEELAALMEAGRQVETLLNP